MALRRRYVVVCVLLVKTRNANCINFKAQLPSLPAQFDGSGSADNMFDELMGKVQVAYDRCPAYIAQVSPNAKPSFERFVSLCFNFFHFQHLIMQHTGSILYLASRRERLSTASMNPI